MQHMTALLHISTITYFICTVEQHAASLVLLTSSSQMGIRIKILKCHLHMRRHHMLESLCVFTMLQHKHLLCNLYRTIKQDYIKSKDNNLVSRRIASITVLGKSLQQAIVWLLFFSIQMMHSAIFRAHYYSCFASSIPYN